MAIQRVMETTGEPKTTVKHTCDDIAETLDDVTGFDYQYTRTYLGQTLSVNVIGCLLTIEDNDIRIAWGTNPTQAGVGHVIAVGQSIKLTNHKQISDFRFINKTNGSDAVIQLTPEVSNV